MRHKTSIQYTKQVYIIKYQHTNTTRHKTMLGRASNIVIVQNNIIRHNNHYNVQNNVITLQTPENPKRQNKTKQNKTKQNKTTQHKRKKQHNIKQYNTTQHSIIISQNNIIRHKTVL